MEGKLVISFLTNNMDSASVAQTLTSLALQIKKYPPSVGWSVLVYDDYGSECGLACLRQTSVKDCTCGAQTSGAHRPHTSDCPSRIGEAKRVAKESSIYLGRDPNEKGTSKLQLALGQVSHPTEPTIHEPE